MMDKANLEVLKSLVRTYGIFAVIVMLHEIGKETCKEYSKLGNDGAVIHTDTMSIANCVEAMKLNGPFPGYRSAAMEITLEEMEKVNAN